MEPTPPAHDFRKLRESGQRPGLSKLIGQGFVIRRTAVARFLLRFGVTPNALTVTNFVVTLGVMACFVMGAGDWFGPPTRDGQSYWMLYAFFVFYIANATDMLDGAVARLGDTITKLGAMLDSTFDRFSDVALFGGICLHFAWKSNVTYAALALICLGNAYSISYIKARAENLIDECSAGYWQRGERNAGLLIACLCSHVPAYLWVLAFGSAFTVLRRLLYAIAKIRSAEHGTPAPNRGPYTGPLRWIALWRHPRGSFGYDVTTGALIASFTIGPWFCDFLYGGTDPLGALLK